MCIIVFPADICVYYMCAWCMQRLEEGLRFSETSISYWQLWASSRVLEVKPGSLNKQQVLWTADSSL